MATARTITPDRPVLDWPVIFFLAIVHAGALAALLPEFGRQGLRWWGVDMTWWLVRGLEATGLAWKIKLPPSRDATTGPKT